MQIVLNLCKLLNLKTNLCKIAEAVGLLNRTVCSEFESNLFFCTIFACFFMLFNSSYVCDSCSSGTEDSARLSPRVLFRPQETDSSNAHGERLLCGWPCLQQMFLTLILLPSGVGDIKKIDPFSNSSGRAHLCSSRLSEFVKRNASRADYAWSVCVSAFPLDSSKVWRSIPGFECMLDERIDNDNQSS